MSVLRIVSNNERSNPFESLGDGLSDIDLLHAISVALIGEQDRLSLYEMILDAAVKIARSQFGTIQLLRQSDERSGYGLELLCSRGLPPDAKLFWQWVNPAASSSCGLALRTGRRAIIPDFEAWAEIAGTEDLNAFRRTGIRSAQTTPLLARDGTLLGMISTHWSDPHEPSERDLRLLDILARQAADLLERTIADEALRAREQELELAVTALRETETLQRMLSSELNHRVKNLFAMVMAITSQTLRTSSDQPQAQALQKRLFTLGTAHDILLQSSWEAAPLGEVAAAAVNSAGVTGRVFADGPPIRINFKSALQTALLIHELATNALKHGSLSVPAGFVELSWTLENNGKGNLVRLTWQEAGGPEISKPSGEGFGSKLINAGLTGSGNVHMSFDRHGLRCEMSATLADLQKEG